jgi:hypothetical protein
VRPDEAWKARQGLKTAASPSSSSPGLLSGSVSLPLAGGARLQVPGSSLSASQTLPAASSTRGRLTGSARAPVARDPAPGDDGKLQEDMSTRSEQGNLHQKFASLRDEMKRQRSPAAAATSLGDQGGRLSEKHTAVLTDLLQQMPIASHHHVRQRQVLGGSLRAAA